MIHFEFVFLKLVTMVLGVIVSYAAYRSSRRYGSRPLLYVAVGFASISVGAGFEGVLYQFTTVSLYQASLVNAGFMALGMGSILYSIYGVSTTRSAKTYGGDRAW